MQVQQEIERKWLVEDIVTALSACMNNDKLEPYHYTMDKPGVEYQIIRQAYVTGDDGVPFRYRLTTDGPDFISGEKTFKTGEGLTRTEKTEQYPEQEIRQIFADLEETGIRPILKVRHIIPHGKYFIEFDSLYGLPGAMKEKYEFYAEIEFPSEEEANAFTDIPKWFGREVTGEKEHNMSSIFEMMQENK